MENDSNDDTGVDANDVGEHPFLANRRQFLQATGALGTTGLLGTTAATAQQLGDTTIELAAVQRGSDGPTDPDGDGLYEDVDGDGEMTYNDVVELFQSFNDPEIQSRAEDFDFNQNDRLDFDDMVTLFQNEAGSGSSGSGFDSGSGSTQTPGYAWLGVSPESISGQTNPTLSLTTGENYTVEWTNQTGNSHNFVIADENGDEISSSPTIDQEGTTQIVEFTAIDTMTAYYSDSHPQAMRGLLEVGSDVEPAPSPATVTYQYFEGLGNSFPDFASLSPVVSGVTPDSEITLALSEQDADYGFVFERDLTVGSLLHPGEYSFRVMASPAIRLLVDGDALVDSPSGSVDTTASVQLTEGTHTLRVEYADPTGDQSLALGWTGPFGQVLPRIAADDPLRSGQGFDWEVEVGPRPAFKQMIMPDSSTRSLAVGLYPNTAYCFDTTTATIRYGWMGGFLDYGPLVNYGQGRRASNSSGNPLGPRFETAGVDAPLRIGSPSAEPEVEFLGFEQSPRPPTLRYSVDDNAVNHTVTPIIGQVGLSHTIEFEDSPSETMYYRTDPNADVQRSATTGQWSDNVLSASAGESELAFTIASTGGEL